MVEDGVDVRTVEDGLTFWSRISLWVATGPEFQCVIHDRRGERVVTLVSTLLITANMLFLSLLPVLAAVSRAQCSDIVSCSPQANGADPCCVPKAGLFLLKQTFDPEAGDEGSWGIESVEVLECVGDVELSNARCDGTPATAASPKLTHEDIARLCASTLDDAAERAWAQSEVGEGLEEAWERSVRAGFCQSTDSSGTRLAALSTLPARSTKPCRSTLPR